jgi:hypothetical protein
MSRELWAAVELLADAWRNVESVQRYAEDLANTQQELGRHLMETLSYMQNLEAQRLLLAPMLQQALPDEYGRFLQQPGADEFHRRGKRLAQAYLWTVEWWRSRLPGYPAMPVPQLARNGPLSSDELPLRVPWRDDLRRRRLQFSPAPPFVPNVLGAAAQPLDEAARTVGAAITRCPQTQELQEAQAALTADDRAALASARGQVRAALHPERLGMEAGDLVVDRMAYRWAVIADIVNRLRGGARRYSDAFRAADRLLEQAAALLSQAVVNGPAPKIGPVLRGERLYGGHGWTEIGIPKWFGIVGQLGDVVLFDTPVLTDAMHIESFKYEFKEGSSSRATIRGELLPDSAWLRAQRWPSGISTIGHSRDDPPKEPT